MKEVEVFGIIMANKFQSSKMRQPIAIMIVICILIQLGIGISQAEVKDFDEEWKPSKEGVAMPLDFTNSKELFIGLVEILSLAESKQVIQDNFSELLTAIYK